jgi:hypothetical protein
MQVSWKFMTPALAIGRHARPIGRRGLPLGSK